MNGLRRSYTHFIVIAVCLGFVFVTGVIQLKSNPLGSDDWNSVKHLFNRHLDPPFTVSETIDSVIRRSPDHGPLYFAMLNIWREFSGNDLFTLRLLSVFFGLLALASVYRLSLLICDKETALVAMFIAAFLSFFIYYTRVARMYSLMPLLSAWVIWSYWRILSSPRSVRWWHWPLLTISAAAIVYVHYFGVFVLAAIGIYHLILAPKNRLWFRTCLAIVAGGILFSPWMPVVADALAIRSVPDGDSLPFVEAVLALLSIYSNGLIVPVLLFGAVVVLKHKQLDRSQRYILIITCLITILMLLANEISPLLIARRIRYTIILTFPLASVMAIGLRLLPRWRMLCFACAPIWILSFFFYYDSDHHLLYTNRLTLNLYGVPHYEDFLYDPSINPLADEFVISFHQDTSIASRIVTYYGRTIGELRGLIHIWQSQDGEAVIRSSDQDVSTMDAIASLSKVWVIYNPQQTDLANMDVYAGWFSRLFRPCNRFLERENNIIDYYLSVKSSCESISNEPPLRIRYNNGLELANLTYEVSEDELTVDFWFAHIPRALTSLSLQIFDQAGEKVRFVDAVIKRQPLAEYTFDISKLAAGDYVVKLIVYDFVSKQSFPGAFVDSQQRFERELDVARLTVGG